LAGGPAAAADDRSRAIERLRVDAFCSGLWARSAQQAADWLTARRMGLAPPGTEGMVPPAAGDLGQVAGSPQVGTQPAAAVAATLSASGVSVRSVRVEAITGWRAAYDTVRARVGSDAGITQTIRQRELDWTSFELEELVLGTETAAHEALLCSRDDGMALGDIQRRSGGRVEAHRSRADELPPSVAAELLAAPVGTGVVGPFRHAQGWSVIWLRARHRPALADEDVRQKAAGALLRQALDREGVGHLRWLGPL
jgi:hypothetical protein